MKIVSSRKFLLLRNPSDTARFSTVEYSDGFNEKIILLSGQSLLLENVSFIDCPDDHEFSEFDRGSGFFLSRKSENNASFSSYRFTGRLISSVSLGMNGTCLVSDVNLLGHSCACVVVNSSFSTTANPTPAFSSLWFNNVVIDRRQFAVTANGSVYEYLLPCLVYPDDVLVWGYLASATISFYEVDFINTNMEV